MITDPLFYLLAIPAVTLLGLSKGGFAGLGMISTPLLALIVPPLEAAAILLPILICQDAISVWTYHRAWSAWNLKVLLPGSVLGVGAGWLFARYLSNAMIELTVGSIALVFVLYIWLGMWLRAYRGHPPAKARRPHPAMGVLWGALSAFTSTLVQVGAPPFQIHMLPQRLDKLTLVGTTVIFFAILNLMKIVPYFALGQFSTAQSRHLGHPAAARGRHQFSRHLAGEQNADRAILPHRLSPDAADRSCAVVAGVARVALTASEPQPASVAQVRYPRPRSSIPIRHSPFSVGFVGQREATMTGAYDTDLDRNPANFQPLTPLSFLARAGEVYPDATAIVHGARSWNYRQFYARARQLASALSRRGIKRGDTVSVMLANTPAMIEAHYGVPMAGAVLNTLNTRLDAAILGFMLDHAETKVLIVDREFSKVMKEALAAPR